MLEVIRQKCAIYIRVSTEEQAKKGISLSAQKDKCQVFAELKDWEVYNIYRDAGFSAGNTKRPAFLRMMEDAHSKRFQTILVYKVDRFSRRLKDLILVLDELKKEGINFTSVTEQIDTNTAMGEAFFQIIGVFAQLERGMIKERVNLAFDRKVKMGETANRAPFGYHYKNKKLVIDEENAPKVRDIFKMWVSGVKYRAISEEFKIPVSSLYEIVKNPAYIGKIRYKGKLYIGLHRPIIDEELFYQINPKENEDSSENIELKELGDNQKI